MNFKKYKFYDRNKEKKIKLIKFLLAIFSVLLIVVGLIIAILFGFFDKFFVKDENLDGNYKSFFNEQKYEKVISIISNKLEKNPLDTELLTYYGFANYFHCLSLDIYEEQIEYIELAITALKKVRVIESKNLSGKIDYVLGKLFFLKGTFFYDESIYYLQSALHLGYRTNLNDLYYFIGLSHSGLGNYDQSLEWFQKIQNINKTDESNNISLLLIAITYFRQKDYNKALVKLEEVKSATKSDKIRLNCEFWRGKIYLEQNKYTSAIQIYKSILNEVKSADAHYNLGLVYKKMNNTIQARAEWRKAIKIEPSHYGALSELN